jgi:hypothetical protein
VQRLLPGKSSPKEFVDDMQDKYAKFTGTL